MDESILPIESVQERDIDLILLEELNVSEHFCQLFVSCFKFPVYTTDNKAWRSVTDFGLGETDLLFSYVSGDQKIYVLIENKLDASFQEDQYLRYMQRAHEYVQYQKCDQAYVVLLAPEDYCNNQDEFNRCLTYEEVNEYFKGLNTERGEFKSQLISIAIEKLRRGYSPISAPKVQDFWHNYWHFKQKNFPEIEMKKPGIIPFKSDWPLLYDNRLENIVFHHKLSQGCVDATYRGYTVAFKSKLEGLLPEWITLVTHSKSFSLRVVTDAIDRTDSFESQKHLVKKGLDNIKKTRDWIISNNQY